MPTRFSLHTHEATASGDSETPARTMADAAANAGLDLVGFVGHDQRPSVPDDLPVETMTGTERELRKEPTRVHVIEFPDQNLRILAHPSLSNPGPEPDDAWAVRAAERLDVDAAESFNRGQKNLNIPGSFPFPTVAGDDAHNTHQVASSYSVTDAPARPRAVARAVKNGEVEARNPGMGRARSAAGKLHQAIAMARWKLGDR